MKWSEFFTSSIGKKFVMALTGIFLILFLVVHAGLNACIFANDGGEMFNKAAYFMGHYWAIKIFEVILFLGFFAHIIQGYLLELKNRKTRGTAYAVSLGNRGSKWYSRSMGLLGTIIFLFLLMHWYQFWLPGRNLREMGVEPVFYEGTEMHNMYALMQLTFSNPIIVAFYVLACISLSFHLMHGFQSSFRTMGVHNKRYMTLIKIKGYAFAIIIPIIFALMPLCIYFKCIH